MMIVLTISIVVIAYMTWRLSAAVWRLNNLVGVALDAIFKVCTHTDMGPDEIRATFKAVSDTFIREHGIDAYKIATGS